ncbi:outer membrane protein OmpK [Chromobacterium sp. TRC.1.1.SA]|uniref:Outer membrane protein OmpK n=1 Tax=Chromobacterium indicum TaxID=3110228 RepID=A0ABV0CIA7_9NEIS
MNTRKSLLALSLLAASALAHAGGEYSFANVSANWLDWSDRTTQQSGKQDFGYLEAEGGLGAKWGELYGFFDIENPGKGNGNTQGRDRRFTTKVVGRYNLAEVGGVPVQLYGHIYDTRGNGPADRHFFTQNRVLGLGTDLSFGALSIKPFFGVHNQMDALMPAGSASGYNGFMTGYVMLYPFQAFGQNLMLTQWHETEFNRQDKFIGAYKAGDRPRVGQNGAVALWWTPTKAVTTGIQYRYADQKLGSSAYQNAVIYSIKYNIK